MFRLSDKSINKEGFLNKKSQITIFIIFGLIVLIIFLFLLSSNKEAESNDLKINNLVFELKEGVIKKHILDCVSLVTMDAIKKIGANGGSIYDFEGGGIPFNIENSGEDFIKFNDYGKINFVNYGLKENLICNYENNAFLYPDINDISLNGFDNEYDALCKYNSFYSAYDGFFGMVSLPKLCYYIKDSYCERFARAQPENTGFTIQRQLEDYIEKNLPLCVNFSSFTERLPVNITNETKFPEAKISIYDSEINLVLKYPIKIVFSNQEPIINIYDYQSTFKVRLGLVYNFLYDILSKDAKNINFDISKDFITSRFWRKGIHVKRVSDVCSDCSFPYNYDDIIKVSDSNSFLLDREFIFKSAIRNRRPIIDFIPNIEKNIDTSNPDSFPLDIPILAFDPDDEPVKLFFFSNTIGYNHDRLMYDFNSDESFSGWYEDSNLINLINSFLNSNNRFSLNPIKRRDSSNNKNHDVGILAVDSSGLFDVEKFNIKINDNSHYLSLSNCSKECVLDLCSPGNINANSKDALYRFNSQQECKSFCKNEWCKVSDSSCRIKCNSNDNWYKNLASNKQKNCFDCVYSVVFADQLQKHKDCALMDNPSLPDCLKIKVFDFEIKKSVPDTWVWYNDFNLPDNIPNNQNHKSFLNNSIHPAYIDMTYLN